MEIVTVIEQALECHKARLEAMGVTVVWQGRPAEIDVGACGEEVGQALEQMIDGVLRAVGSGKERRLVVWARNANRGAIVGIEYRGGSYEQAHPRLTLSRGQEQLTLRSVAKCRKLLEKRGGRLFVRSSEFGSVRFVMELPFKGGEMV